MTNGKWISELSPSTPLADAARRVLAIRLEVVRDYLPLAMRQSHEDLEYVHQLRVSTRRAGAAVDIFSVCLPEKTYRSTRKALKTIRRAAGGARDWDVFLMALTPSKNQQARKRPIGDLLLGYGLGHRSLAQGALENACPNFPFSFQRLMAETVAEVQKPRNRPELRTLSDLAQPVLVQLLQALSAAAAQDLNDYSNLHQVRIRGKRLRYAMEIFVDCFAPAFRKVLYSAVEEMQDILGEANDSHVATLWLADIRHRLKVSRPHEWRRFRGGLDSLTKMHEQRIVRQRSAFQEFWTRWQSIGDESAFHNLLLASETRQVDPNRSLPAGSDASSSQNGQATGHVESAGT